MDRYNVFGVLGIMFTFLLAAVWYYGVMYSWIWCGLVSSSAIGWVVGYVVLFVMFLFISILVTMLLGLLFVASLATALD